MKMDYPTEEEVQKGSHEELARWCRFLPSPMTEEQLRVINYTAGRLKTMGGFTPEISKRIGWRE
jgi:hypothetical protein